MGLLVTFPFSSLYSLLIFRGIFYLFGRYVSSSRRKLGFLNEAAMEKCHSSYSSSAYV